MLSSMNRMNGTAERNSAENRPSAARALTLRRSLKRVRMTSEGVCRRSLRRPPGEVRQELAQPAAGGGLDPHRGDEQRQILLADAEIQVAHRRLDIGPLGDLV